MSNNDAEIALHYHQATNHSQQNISSNTWRRDWSNRRFLISVMFLIALGQPYKKRKQ